MRINASKVFPEKIYNCLKEKKPDKPTPPSVIWKIPINTRIDDIHANRKLLYDNRALIGVGQGCKAVSYTHLRAHET